MSFKEFLGNSKNLGPWEKGGKIQGIKVKFLKKERISLAFFLFPPSNSQNCKVIKREDVLEKKDI